MSATTLPDRIDTAVAHHEAGRLADAEAIYRDVLADDPDDPEALNLLGLILQDRGEVAESVGMISRAVAIDPGYAEAHVNLSRGQRALRQAEAAAASAGAAITLAPELAEAHVALGRALLDLGRPDDAIAPCRKAVAMAPDVPDGQVTLGLALQRTGDAKGAETALRKALEAKPQDVATWRALGVALGEQERHDEATATFQHVLSLAPDEAQNRAAYAVALGKAQRIREAADACTSALALAPQRADLWIMLSTHKAALGDFAAAEDHLRHALTIDPDNAEARRELVSINRTSDGGDEEAGMLAIAEDASRPLFERAAACYGLGGLYDKKGEYDTAFAFFSRANAMSLEDAAGRGKGFNPGEYRRSIDLIIGGFQAGAFMATLGWGHASDLPVFIVGLPRSGTTLVEQIASSHPLVHGAGERKDIPHMLERITHGDHVMSPVQWNRDAVRQETSAHIGRLQRMAPDAFRIIDKLPDNIQVIGHIAVLFPNARIILCRRDLRDVCLSCYVQRFSEGITWSQDLGMMAQRVQETERLVRHWKHVAPVRLMEVQYETLVGDLEGQARRLIDFLGLPWDPACLEYRNNDRAVITASRWQVRQPIYTNSVGRWRNYQAHLGPLLEGLGGLIPEDD